MREWLRAIYTHAYTVLFNPLSLAVNFPIFTGKWLIFKLLFRDFSTVDLFFQCPQIGLYLTKPLLAARNTYILYGIGVNQSIYIPFFLANPSLHA